MTRSTYSFFDPDLRHGVCLWLEVHQIRFSAICGNSIQVDFPSPADRDAFESLVVCGASAPDEVRYLDSGNWQSLPRKPYIDQGIGTG